MKVSSIVLQVLRWGSREVHRETCELDIACPIVDDTQISETTPCMFAVDCVSSCAFADGKISRLFLSQRSVPYSQSVSVYSQRLIHVEIGRTIAAIVGDPKAGLGVSETYYGVW